MAAVVGIVSGRALSIHTHRENRVLDQRVSIASMFHTSSQNLLVVDRCQRLTLCREPY